MLKGERIFCGSCGTASPSPSNLPTIIHIFKWRPTPTSIYQPLNPSAPHLSRYFLFGLFAAIYWINLHLVGEGGGVASYRAVSMRARCIHLILCRINRVGKGNVHFYYFDSNVPRDLGMKMKYNETWRVLLCDELKWRLYEIILDGQLVNTELGPGACWFLLPGRRIYRGCRDVFATRKGDVALSHTQEVAIMDRPIWPECGIRRKSSFLLYRK